MIYAMAEVRFLLKIFTEYQNLLSYMVALLWLNEMLNLSHS